MKHTECKDCKLSNGDCGYHFKMNGKTDYDIPSETACDKYGECMFFQQEEKQIDVPMKKFVYEFGFVDGSHMKLESIDEIDFRNLKMGAIVFPDVFINMANVTYITKKEKNQDV